MANFQVFGIRHHGAGSARRLHRALSEWSPDCILVELPADAEDALKGLKEELPTPPVAILLYDPKEIEQALYYPFAEFSPEWVALTYANKHQIPFQPIDLPAGISLQLKVEDQAVKARDPLDYDPMGHIAQIAGYTDSERWWEATFEQDGGTTDAFSAVLMLMTQLRQGLGRNESRDTLMREAHMRLALRKALREGYERIAVVCGAWHAPVLHEVARFKVGDDRSVLKGWKKKKIAGAWIPWSYPRLARKGGYGAGVTAPQWYEYLFRTPEAAGTYWLGRAARLLREEGYAASPARVQDASRLAQALAAMREHPLPGLDTLLEAAQACLTDGKEDRLKLLHDRLVIGTKIGLLPEQLSRLPVQQDFEAQLKKTRLTKYWGDGEVRYLKASPTNPYGGIDLRQATDLAKSHFLHRLNVLNIKWGTCMIPDYQRQLGSFKEIWKMKWTPETSLYLLDTARYGNTIEQATIAKARELAQEGAPLANLIELLGQLLKAGLPEACEPVLQALQTRSVDEQDVETLLRAVPPLVEVLTYGDVRQTDLGQLGRWYEEVIVRIGTMLPAAAHQLEAEAAEELYQPVLAAHYALRSQSSPHWSMALKELAQRDGTAPLLQGLAVRLEFDGGTLSPLLTEVALARSLSPGNPDEDRAYWIQGFLTGGLRILLHHRPLWTLLDDWVQSVPTDSFPEVLPLLRRAFADFPLAEREMLLKRLHQPVSTTTSRPVGEIDTVATSDVLVVYQRLLGLN